MGKRKMTLSSMECLISPLCPLSLLSGPVTFRPHSPPPWSADVQSSVDLRVNTPHSAVITGAFIVACAAPAISAFPAPPSTAAAKEEAAAERRTRGRYRETLPGARREMSPGVAQLPL